MQRHRPVVERTERQEVGESFEQRIDEVDRKCQPEQRKDLLVVCVIMFAPTGDDDIILVGGKEQCRDEVEDQRRDEQPEKQEQRPVRDVAPAVLHPPGDDYCQKHVHHPERVHPVGWRAGAGLEQLAEPAHQPRHREAGDNRGENAYVTKRIHLGFDYGQAYLACRSQAMRGVRFNQKSSSITTFRFRLGSARASRAMPVQLGLRRPRRRLSNYLSRLLHHNRLMMHSRVH